MATHFDRPVLSIAIDAVSDLDGDDDCHALWAVFSKCRDSIAEGARVENMAWRLWSRELGAPLPKIQQEVPLALRPLVSAHDFSSDSDSGDLSETSDSALSSVHPDDLDVCEPPPITWAPPRAPPASSVTSERRPLAKLSSSQPATSSTRPPLESRAHSAPTQRAMSRIAHPGRIITALLHEPLVLAPRNRVAQPLFRSAVRSEISPLMTPTPSDETLSPAPTPAEPVVIPSTPPSPSTAASCPAVVVVNPTPHPTPPPTPRVEEPLPTASAALPSLMPPSLMPFSALRGTPRSPSTCTSDDPDNEADRRSRARFFLSREPGSPEQSPDSDGTNSTPASSNTLGSATAPINGDGSSKLNIVAPPPPRQADDHADTFTPSSVTSSHLDKGTGSVSSSGFRGKPRKGKEVVRAHVTGRAAAVRPVFAYRQSHLRHPPHAGRNQASTAVGKTSLHQTAVAPKRSAEDAESAQVPPSAAVVTSDPGPSKPRAEITSPVAEPVPARPASPILAFVAPTSRKVEITSSEFESDSDGEESSWASDDDEAEAEGAVAKPDLVSRAASDAARQRDMFAKLPTRSYSNLDKLPRAGLLSSMFRPDTAVHSQSAQELARPRRISALTQQAPPGPSQGFPLRKSSTVAPVTQDVNAQATVGPNGRYGGYRPRGPPDGQQDDSDSGEDDPDDRVQISKSVAQRRLEAIAGPSRRRVSPQEAPVKSSPPLPVPVAYPHNAQPPTPLSPRTTRRNMLQAEMSESLRANILWQRTVTNRAIGAAARTRTRMRPLTSSGEAGSQTQAVQTVPQGAPASGMPAAHGPPVVEQRRKPFSKNRSWAGDFHFAGW